MNEINLCKFRMFSKKAQKSAGCSTIAAPWRFVNFSLAAFCMFLIAHCGPLFSTVAVVLFFWTTVKRKFYGLQLFLKPRTHLIISPSRMANGEWAFARMFIWCGLFAVFLLTNRPYQMASRTLCACQAESRTEPNPFDPGKKIDSLNTRVQRTHSVFRDATSSLKRIRVNARSVRQSARQNAQLNVRLFRV